MKIEAFILIVVLGIFTLYTISTCNEINKISRGEIESTVKEVVYVQRFDSAQKSIPVDKPILIRDSIFVATNLPIDTLEIIRKYFTSYFYKDTFSNKELSLILSDSIYNNQISFRDIQYKILRPDSIITQTITITKPVNKPVWFTGIGIGFTGKSFSAIPKVSYSNKNNLFEAGLFLNSNSSPGIYAGLNIRIK
ncbi:MAG: hypothetical protein K9H61_02265 [Bacteroidia bacterium]|nr:hypothetical protein [Bacteroidia bacterium]MCF8427150.1 hypothetical protein [Bacteroidia bacterium]MCF8445795.1 hypothetical protein [Bacteroidia bacterium]